MSDRPNVLLVITDQHRGDAVGADPDCPRVDGDPVVHTPTIDRLAGTGTLFRRAYSPVPSCVPARRCLWTGRTPANCDATYYHGREWAFDSPMPERLRDSGYQTRLVGKHHGRPMRNHCGFEHLVLHDGLSGERDDYERWLDRRSGGAYGEVSHGIDRNSWDPRPSHLPEHEHPTTWTTERALDFLDRRDPTRPFFLTLSYVRPHQPFDPPRPYWDMYVDESLPEPHMGEWVDRHADQVPDNPATDAWLADLPDRIVHRARAGYYGLITQIDHQLGRVVDAIPSDTVVLFTADHGEMLGDHQHWRKTYAYEGSARIPFIVSRPDDSDGAVVDAPVGLTDVAPTVLDAAGMAVPEVMDGRSVLSLRDGDSARRSAYHGEHGPCYADTNACQFLVDERWKYIWNPVTGSELLFDLENDPGETSDLSTDPEAAEHREAFRAELARRLADRPEGFVEDGSLRPVEPGAWR